MPFPQSELLSNLLRTASQVSSAVIIWGHISSAFSLFQPATRGAHLAILSSLIFVLCQKQLFTDINWRSRLNRYSMPVTRSKTGLFHDHLDKTNTTGFLFGDEGDSSEQQYSQQASSTDDKFPMLRRPENQMVSLSFVLCLRCLGSSWFRQDGNKACECSVCVGVGEILPTSTASGFTAQVEGAGFALFRPKTGGLRGANVGACKHSRGSLTFGSSTTFFWADVFFSCFFFSFYPPYAHTTRTFSLPRFLQHSHNTLPRLRNFVPTVRIPPCQVLFACRLQKLDISFYVIWALFLPLPLSPPYCMPSSAGGNS